VQLLDRFKPVSILGFFSVDMGKPSADDCKLTAG
jgi:hypothetical protein